jgi:hypothetical protein
MTAGATVYRRMQVRYGERGELNFGDGIVDPIEADWLATRVGEALGLTPAIAAKDRCTRARILMPC